VRHVGTHAWQRKDLMGVRLDEIHKSTLATGTGLWKKRYRCGGCQQDWWMVGMSKVAARSASLRRVHASLTLFCRRIG